MSRLPDYLIIGTMKGGTTALQDFICLHPQVVAPSQKEIHYFSLFPDLDVKWYESHFAAAPNMLTGEASPTYFDVAYTSAIPRLIKKLLPDVKLILVTRNPVERAVSHFYHLQKVNNIEALQGLDINDFFCRPVKQVLSQESEVDYYLHQVIDFSFYWRKYLNYASVFDKSSILAIGAEDLRQSAKTTMSKVFCHLGLPDFYDREYEEIKYSSGKTASALTDDTRAYLEGIFSTDYKLFKEYSTE